LTCPTVNVTSMWKSNLKDFVRIKFYLVDGGWSPWSICEQDTAEKCQCRTRSCTQPEARLDGKLCQGNHIEISRCEGTRKTVCFLSVLLNFSLVHGGWSLWSNWSICPQTCDKTFRSRIRTCTNPEPKNNGRLCVGSEREEEPCPEIICSSETSRLSTWSGKYHFPS
jgi:hypothetical protein